MNNSLTILMIPYNGLGHINACIGFGETLRDRGHKIVFVIEDSLKGVLKRYEFVEEILENPLCVEQLDNVKDGEKFARFLLSSGILSDKSSFEKVSIRMKLKIFEKITEKTIGREPALKKIIDRHNPDVIVINHFVVSPQILYSNKPWVFLYSGNPLFVIYDERTPPTRSGYPIDGDKSTWNEFRELNKNALLNALKFYNKVLTDNGYQKIEGNRPDPHSPHLNIYQYPEELDYTDIRPNPEKWFRIDALIREGEEEFELPEKLKQNTDPNSKLIYLSMGTIGSIDVELMKRIVAILSKSNHRFIVSKGIRHEEYELSDNMWGQRSVPQTKVLPLVDLVITHGGNNTVTETFSFGKPMIVMPLFADQYDNAQRIDEKGFGIRLDPYNCSENDLLESIDKLLNDSILKEKLSKASERIFNSNTKTRAAELIENLVK